MSMGGAITIASLSGGAVFHLVAPVALDRGAESKRFTQLARIRGVVETAIG